jgi:hypothetical protein
MKKTRWRTQLSLIDQRTQIRDWTNLVDWSNLQVQAA